MNLHTDPHLGVIVTSPANKLACETCLHRARLLRELAHRRTNAGFFAFAVGSILSAIAATESSPITAIVVLTLGTATGVAFFAWARHARRRAHALHKEALRHA